VSILLPSVHPQFCLMTIILNGEASSITNNKSDSNSFITIDRSWIAVDDTAISHVTRNSSQDMHCVRVRARLARQRWCCSCARDTRGCGGLSVGRFPGLLDAVGTQSASGECRLVKHSTASSMAHVIDVELLRCAGKPPL